MRLKDLGVSLCTIRPRSPQLHPQIQEIASSSKHLHYSAEYFWAFVDCCLRKTQWSCTCLFPPEVPSAVSLGFTMRFSCVSILVCMVFSGGLCVFARLSIILLSFPGDAPEVVRCRAPLTTIPNFFDSNWAGALNISL